MQKKIVSAIAVIALMVLSLGAYLSYRVVMADNTNFDQEERVIFIQSDATIDEVLNNVSPLLKNPADFVRLAKQKGYYDFFKPGRFVLVKGMSNNDIINVLRSENKPIRVIVPSMERLEDVLGYVSQFIEADSLDLLRSFNERDFLFQTKLNSYNVLSLVIPNTYEFYWNTSATQFRSRMLKEHGAFWNDKRLARAHDKKLSPAEVYTLASIVAKESVKPEESRTIAGVYLNRLKRKMKLQADPTVIYALKERYQSFDTIIRRVLYKDLLIESPYNTYQISGLPVGPITMPEIRYIDAVLEAEKHDYLFFVADSTRIGYHDFSKNLSEHKAKAKAYSAWLNSRQIRR